MTLAESVHTTLKVDAPKISDISRALGGPMTRRVLMNSLMAIPIASALPVAAVAANSDPDDCRLFEIENEIFELKDKIEDFDPEILRLQGIWRDEFVKFEETRSRDECAVSRTESWETVTARSSSVEHNRLFMLQRRLREQADQLARLMWSIPARTPEGKRAKVLVLLGYVMGDDWRAHDVDAGHDIRMARELLMEFVGGEPATELRLQFAV